MSTYVALEAPLVPYGSKQCGNCLEIKPLREFYGQHDNRKDATYPSSQCKDCENSKPRNRTLPRVLRNRARNRATALLIERRREEFEALLEQETEKVWAEHQEISKVSKEAIPRLKPGARREGQTVLERIDVARCTVCHTNHDRGHVCPVCGHRDEESGT